LSVPASFASHPLVTARIVTEHARVPAGIRGKTIFRQTGVSLYTALQQALHSSALSKSVGSFP
jgi:hypothetical protein